MIIKISNLKIFIIDYHHQFILVPRSEWAIYHEVSSGPFIKSKNVLYGNFAPSENTSFESINYVNNILGDESQYKKQ